MTLVLIVLGIVTGICLYVGLFHLLIACGKLQTRLHLHFGLVCLGCVSYILALMLRYQAANVEDYIAAQKLVCSVGYIYAVTVVWFIAVFTKIKPVRLILVLNSLYAISLLINQISPTGILYSHVSSLSSVSLPWGESIYYPEGTLNPLFGFQLLALNSNTIFAVSTCYLQYRRGEKQAALSLGVSLAIQIVAVQHDRLVDLEKIQFIYLTEFGYLSFAIIMSLRLSKDLMQAVKLREQLLESERLRKIAVEVERNRLARDLHDSVSQTLFTVATTAEALPRVWKRNPDIAQQGLEELAQLTQGALAEMRNLLIELRPDGLAEKPLGELIQQLTKAISGRASLQVTTTVKGDFSLSSEVKLVFYRITQEALNNIIKHAQATLVSVSLEYDSQKLVLGINDNGCGFDLRQIPISSGHLGIAIMKERAESIGATFHLSSYPGEGTEIVLSWSSAVNKSIGQK
ncbi:MULTISPECIES: sensor histidine kinase [unclassified Nostoc]|uniref:sensor histidine kinase n=1 Tax=unclassified Nostoc TaxID=2593658 RepID=UPI002AD2F88D|nr:sensor histidine kinase [Nostoc sp. DedQUE03]MDZ7973344.1 sensor histidine kinase [Nostoc sp. DedQUE03]MDZ8045383.1 sensor histidine kinase [Nostoc sp. DedQUE02]